MSGPLGRYFCHYQSGLKVLLSDRVGEGSNWKLSFFSKNEKPAHSDHYCMQHAVNCLWLHRLSYHCRRFHPKDTKCKIVDALGLKTCQTAETSHSQSTQEPAFTTAHTLLVMKPMAVHFCPWSNDVSEACGLLQECKVIKEEYEFREEKSSFCTNLQQKEGSGLPSIPAGGTSLQ